MIGHLEMRINHKKPIKTIKNNNNLLRKASPKNNHNHKGNINQRTKKTKKAMSGYCKQTIYKNENQYTNKEIRKIINANEKLKDIDMMFEMLNDKEKRDFYVLLFFLMSLISITDEKKCISILKKYRNKDVVIPNYINDKNLESFYHGFKQYVPQLTRIILDYEPNISDLSNLPESSHTYNGVQTGGYYFKRLEEKGDEPITGSDISRLLDEIQGITGSLRYTPDGRNLTTFDTMLGFFRGNEESLTSYLKFFVAPRFYTIYPFPMLKNIFVTPKPNSGEEKQLERFAGGAPLWERYEDIADYLLAYQSYDRAKKQYFVDEGLLSPDVLDPTFMEKLTNKLDIAATKYSQAKMLANKQVILGMY